MNTSETPDDICRRVGSDFVPPLPGEKVGISRTFRLDEYPWNGLRHRPAAGTCGWYLWSGEEWSEDPDFFEPHHVDHLPESMPGLLPYLALAPGWRLLLAPGYEDIWYDEALLLG